MGKPSHLSEPAHFSSLSLLTLISRSPGAMIIIEGTRKWEFFIPQYIVSQSDKLSAALVNRDAEGRRFARFEARRVDPLIFGLLLEIVLTSDGLGGVEPGASLAMILASLHMAIHFNFWRHYNKFGQSLKAHIQRRFFKVNPWTEVEGSPRGLQTILYMALEVDEAFQTYRQAVQHSTIISDLVDENRFVWMVAAAVPGWAYQHIRPKLSLEFVSELSELFCSFDQVTRSRHFPHLWVWLSKDAGVIPEWFQTHEPVPWQNPIENDGLATAPDRLVVPPGVFMMPEMPH